MSFLELLQSNFKFVMFIFICNSILAIWLNYISYFSDSPLWFVEKCVKSFGVIFVVEIIILQAGWLLLKVCGGGNYIRIS